MRTNTLIILAAITVPVTALALLMPNQSTAPVATGAQKPVLPGLRAKFAEATKLTIVGSDGTVTVNRAKPDKKADGGWTIANKGNYPVPPATIKPVLDGLAALREIEPKTERSALYDRLDLKNPGKDSQSHGVTLSGENGATLASVVLGKHKYDNGAGNNDRQYVRIPGTNQAWLAGPAVTLPDETLDWIDKSVLDLDPNKIKQVTVTQPNGDSLTIMRAKPSDKFVIQNAPAGAKPKSDTSLSEVAGGFHTVELSDVKQASGLAGTPMGTAQATTFDGLTTTITLTKQGDSSWARVTATGTGAATKQADALTARTGGWAYQVTDAKAATLESKLADVATLPPKPAEKPVSTPVPTKPDEKK